MPVVNALFALRRLFSSLSPWQGQSWYWRTGGIIRPASSQQASGEANLTLPDLGQANVL